MPTDDKPLPSRPNDSLPTILLSPIEFAEKKLGIECWPKMREIMQAVMDGKRKILVRSCNGAGKTTTIAALCNWMLSEFDESIVLTTASSWTQVRRTLWGEIRRQARRLDYGKKSIAKTSIHLNDKHYALGISPSMPENAMGFHAPRMLIAVDEATGVDREIIDALSGNLTGESAQMILICNPINIQSYPYEAEESGEWHLITMSAFDHPNVISGKDGIKGAVTRTWIEDRLKSWSHEVEIPDLASRNSLYVPWLDKWYKKTAIVQSRILGEWADNDSEGFISMDLIKRATQVAWQVPPPAPDSLSCPEDVLDRGEIRCRGRHLPREHHGLRSLGVDIARNRDATVFALFEGDVQLPFEVFYGTDLMETADRIKQKYDEGFEIIAVDDGGIGGGVTDRLKHLGVKVYPVNFSQRAQGFLKDRKELANARAEMYFVLEEELRDQSITLFDDKQLQQELAAIRLTTNGHSTAYQLEDKELVRRRLGRSPDRADATALARYGVRLKAHEKRLAFF